MYHVGANNYSPGFRQDYSPNNFSPKRGLFAEPRIIRRTADSGQKIFCPYNLQKQTRTVSLHIPPSPQTLVTLTSITSSSLLEKSLGIRRGVCGRNCDQHLTSPRPEPLFHQPLPSFARSFYSTAFSYSYQKQADALHQLRRLKHSATFAPTRLPG